MAAFFKKLVLDLKQKATSLFVQGAVAFVLGGMATRLFPPFAGSVIGYIGLLGLMLLLFVANRSKKSLFWLAYVFGFSFSVGGFAWINNALLVGGDALAKFIPLVVLAIGCFFALFWAIPVAIAGVAQNKSARVLLFAVAYVFFEWVRSFIFTGFPWNLLGTAFVFDARLIQGAAYIGTYGLSLLLLLILGGLVLLVLGGVQKKFCLIGLLMVLLPSGFMWFTATNYQPVVLGESVVRLVQPSIPQTLKWNRELAYKNFRQHIDLSKKESLAKVKLVVWGEAACPYFLDRDVVHLHEITEAVPEDGFLITGLLRSGMQEGEFVAFNSMFVIDKSGEIKDYYDKSHLVPFGEYLPFRQYLPAFMKPVANVVGDLGRGEKYKNIDVKGLPVLGGAICYESIFPKEVINPNRKPEVLVVLANDGWYGISAGPFQHLAAAQMRAVEEGISVVRSANTGISVVIAPNGKVIDKIGLNVVGYKDIALPKVLAIKTFYGTYGNIVPAGLLLLLVILILVINATKNCTKPA